MARVGLAHSSYPPMRGRLWRLQQLPRRAWILDKACLRTEGPLQCMWEAQPGDLAVATWDSQDLCHALVRERQEQAFVLSLALSPPVLGHPCEFLL